MDVCAPGVVEWDTDGVDCGFRDDGECSCDLCGKLLCGVEHALVSLPNRVEFEERD